MLESFVMPCSLFFLFFAERPTLSALSLSLGLVVDVPPGPLVCADALMPASANPTMAATAKDCTLFICYPFLEERKTRPYFATDARSSGAASLMPSSRRRAERRSFDRRFAGILRVTASDSCQNFNEDRRCRGR